MATDPGTDRRQARDASSGRRRVNEKLARTGRAGWMLVGTLGAVAATVLAVGVLLPLVLPVLVMVVIAVSLQPGVVWLRRHRVPPGLAALCGALAVPVLLVALAVLFGYAVVVQASGWQDVVTAAGDYLDGALGADPLRTILRSGQWRTALVGVGSVLTSGTVIIAQVAVGVLAAAYLLFYAFLDGPRFVAAIESRLPVPAGLAETLRTGAASQLRRYVLGTTIVAALDAVVITGGAIILDLPFLLTIAVITFVAAYVPYLGAWLSATFVVVIALGAGGLSTGLWMLGIVLLTQNILEGVLRPLVFGRALGLHPVVVLTATVVGAALGGLAGVFLAPPVTAIAVVWWQAVRAGRTPPVVPDESPRHQTGDAGA